MPKCESCGEWFVGHGSLCHWCLMRINVGRYINERRGVIWTREG